MATTDAKTGFRLPWSSDRAGDSHESPGEPEAPAETAPAASAWPEADLGSRSVAATTSGLDTSSDLSGETPAAPEPAPVPEPAAPKKAATAKPTKFLADLTRAMRTAAEAAREQTLSQFQADATAFVELLRERSSGGSAELKTQADTDVAAIREWSKAEIARIREETDQRITDRKAQLERETEQHAAHVERQVEHVHAAVGSFEREMAAFFEELLEEQDPARFASMAETLPEPPRFEDILPEAWLESDEPTASAAETTVAEAALETVIEDEPTTSGWDEVEAEAAALTVDTVDGATPATDPSADADAPTAEVDDRAAVTEPVTASSAEDGAPAGEAEPVDRAAIMAALEAAADAVVAAEMAAESANQAETAAGVAETAAELLTQRIGDEPAGAWPTADFEAAEAEAASAALDDLDGEGEIPEIEESALAGRLAGLVPASADGAAAGGVPVETKSTQIVVVGLVSVASIASFKRHLGRVAGVQSVGVSSGPDGEFVFAVNHRSDVSFKDVVPTLPGFAARVTGSGDGILNVTARDPEAES